LGCVGAGGVNGVGDTDPTGPERSQKNKSSNTTTVRTMAIVCLCSIEYPATKKPPMGRRLRLREQPGVKRAKT
jgi:hypothetical protein